MQHFYVYAGDRTEHPFLFAPFSHVHLFPKQFKHGIIDCGFSYLKKRQVYPENFIEDYIQILRKVIKKRGNRFWCVPPDYPCEPKFFKYDDIDKRIVQTIESTEKCLTYKEIDWLIPIQGLRKKDYLHCIDVYQERGIGYSACPWIVF